MSATSYGRRDTQPDRRRLPWLALALGLLVAGSVGFVSTAVGLAAGGVCAAAAAVDVLLSRHALARRRAFADHVLLTLAYRTPTGLQWRAAELTSTRERRILARSLRGIVRMVDRGPGISASMVNRRAAVPHRETILDLSDRMGRMDEPVDARGVILVRRLLTDGSGPLYDREREGELGTHLAAARAALEPR